MQFAIILLVLVVLACMLGSLITQRNALPLSLTTEADFLAYYTQQYGARTAALIMGLRLDDVFHSWWFITLTALLCLSLLACNLSRVRSLIRKTKDAAKPEHAIAEAPTATAQVADPEPVLRRLRFFRPAHLTIDGKETVFAYRNRLGYWGAWVCHLGIVLIVLGYALGQMTLYSSYVYGTPGETLAIENTDCSVTVDDFTIERNADGFIQQYTTALTVTDGAGNRQSGTTGVNHPATLLGYKFYQQATGQTANVTLLLDGEPIATERVMIGDELTIGDIPGLVFVLQQFDTTHGVYYIPRYVNGAYAPWDAETVAPDEPIDLAPFPYALRISEPIDTMLRVKKDSFAWLVLVGAVLCTLGLFFALYVVPETVWAFKNDDGTWTLNGKSRKLAPLFCEQFDRAVSGRKRKEARV